MEMLMDLETRIKETPTTTAGDITDHTRKSSTSNPTVEMTTVEDMVEEMTTVLESQPTMRSLTVMVTMVEITMVEITMVETAMVETAMVEITMELTTMETITTEKTSTPVLQIFPPSNRSPISKGAQARTNQPCNQPYHLLCHLQ